MTWSTQVWGFPGALYFEYPKLENTGEPQATHIVCPCHSRVLQQRTPPDDALFVSDIWSNASIKFDTPVSQEDCLLAAGVMQRNTQTV